MKTASEFSRFQNKPDTLGWHSAVQAQLACLLNRFGAVLRFGYADT
jgi:hypothetical protein